MSESTTPNESTNTASTPRRRKWAFRLIAVLIGLLPFVVLEIALRAFDVGRPTELSDPFVGFSKLHPQFELDEDAGEYVTTRSRRLYFGTQRFAETKPKNGFRVFCLGGSTVRGRPYTVDTAFAMWMQRQLAACDPQTKYKVVNCGGLSYASYRLRPMTEEILRYDPDLVVIATGHNEFLEDRTYKHIKEQSQSRRKISESVYSLRIVTAARKLLGDKPGAVEDNRPKLPDELATKLDDESGYASYHRDDEWRKRIRQHFNHSLRAMITMCRDNGVPVVLVRLGSNLRDCPPFKSEHKPGLSEADARRWRDLFAKATRMDTANDGEALKLYNQAAAIDDEHALLLYRLARCYDRLKRFPQAEKYYRLAKDFDICPLRMLDAMADDVAKIAKETETPLVDAATMLERQSPQGISGNNFYMDHVHPTIGGHQQIARAIIANMQQHGTLPTSYKPWNASKRRGVYHSHFQSLGGTYWARAKRRLEWLESWARRRKMLAETQPVDARGHLHYGHRRFDLGDVELAWKDYMTAYRLEETVLNRLLARGLLLFEQGRFAQLKPFLEKLRTVANPPLRNEVDLARLVLAVESGDARQTASILGALGSEVATVSRKSKWHAVMPDVLQRAEKLVE